MRTLALLFVLFIVGCAGAAAQTAPTLGNPNAPWRANLNAADRETAHNCLVNGGDCESVIQTPCLNAYDEDERSPALARRCDWRAMAAWEDEVLAILADLRSKLGGDDLKNLNDSEAAWETSMLADVGLGMDYYAGGSIAGPIGAHIRAVATARRAAYLYEIQQMVDE